MILAYENKGYLGVLRSVVYFYAAHLGLAKTGR